MKRILAIILIVTMSISIAACGSTPDETLPESNSIQIGNLLFLIDPDMTAEKLGENSYLVTLKEEKAFVSIYAGDVSSMGVDAANVFTSIQHKTFMEDRDTILSSTDTSMDIAGFSADGEACSTISDSGMIWGHLDLSFTDTWYSYTLMFQYIVGYKENVDSDTAYNNGKEYGEKYRSFLDSVSYVGPAPRESDTKSGNERPQTSPSEETPTTQPSEKGSKDNPYRAGTYKVGIDCPAGEYIFFSNGSQLAYVCASSDSNQDDIIENENFSNSFFMTVADGQYLQAKRCYFVKASDYNITINDDGTLEEGMYRVGVDMPAGEYQLTADEDKGYWCLYSDSTIPFDIDDNDNFEGSTYVTVRDGQYLQVKRCTAKPA